MELGDSSEFGSYLGNINVPLFCGFDTSSEFEFRFPVHPADNYTYCTFP